MNCGLLLNVVVSHGAHIVELFAREDEALLVAGDALSGVDFCLHAFDSFVGLDVQSDGLASQCLHEHLHCATAEAEHKVKGRFLLDVVVAECSGTLKLLSCKDKTLRVGRDSFLVLNLGLNVLN